MTKKLLLNEWEELGGENAAKGKGGSQNFVF